MLFEKSIAVKSTIILTKLSLLVFLLNWVQVSNLDACIGPPRQPICGKTVVFAKASPPHQVINNPTGPVQFSVPVTVFIQRTAGCDLLPAPVVPVSVTISLTVNCNPGPGGSGFLVSSILVDGFNNFSVPVTVPAGQPRICNITGSATVTFSDGMTFTSSGDTVVCLVEPSPTDPNTPRLDLELLTPSIDNVHPGDQATMSYRITNNDPDESWSGSFTANLQNATDTPTEGIMYNPDGTGLYSLAEPNGDHYPIAFGDDLLPGLCVPLPLDPQLTQPGQIDRLIELDPGEQITIDVIARPWGGCANGSCGEATVILDGFFSDSTEGFACAGAVVANDTSREPDFICPGSGSVARFSVVNAQAAQGRFTAPTPMGDPVDLDFDFNTLEVDGGIPDPIYDFMAALDDFTGRAQFYPFAEGPFEFIQGSSEFRVAPNGIDPLWERVDRLTGLTFGDIAPAYKHKVNADIDGDGNNDVCFEIEIQTSVHPVDGINFLTPTGTNDLSELFTDGFESGNISRWSATVPERGNNPTIDNYQVYFDMRAFMTDSVAPYPCPMDTTADFDGDGLVTATDLQSLYPGFALSATSPQDRDGDLLLTLADLVEVNDKVGCQESGAPGFARR
jgi:hypothetical protein